MRAGPMRHRVILQSPAGSRDAVGERTTTWTDVDTVWADIQPLTVRDQLLADQAYGLVSHKVLVRYSSTISAIDHSWRVKFGTRILVLNAPPRNIGERNRTLELLCLEGPREE